MLSIDHMTFLHGVAFNLNLTVLRIIDGAEDEVDNFFSMMYWETGGHAAPI